MGCRLNGKSVELKVKERKRCFRCDCRVIECSDLNMYGKMPEGNAPIANVNQFRDETRLTSSFNQCNTSHH